MPSDTCSYKPTKGRKETLIPRYSEERRQAVVAKLLPPQQAVVTARPVAQGVGEKIGHLGQSQRQHHEVDALAANA